MPFPTCQSFTSIAIAIQYTWLEIHTFSRNPPKTSSRCLLESVPNCWGSSRRFESGICLKSLRVMVFYKETSVQSRLLCFIFLQTEKQSRLMVIPLLLFLCCSNYSRLFTHQSLSGLVQISKTVRPWNLTLAAWIQNLISADLQVEIVYQLILMGSFVLLSTI